MRVTFGLTFSLIQWQCERETLAVRIAQAKARLDDSVTKHMHQDFARLRLSGTVGEALDGVRSHPPAGRIIYFYVVDEEEVICGVVPTRRLILSPRDRPLAEITIKQVITLPAAATVLEACELFIQHRLLALPVVDEKGRMLGVVDMELYADELTRLDDAQATKSVSAGRRLHIRGVARDARLCLPETISLARLQSGSRHLGGLPRRNF